MAELPTIKLDKVQLIAKLLIGERNLLQLLARNPFPEQPPRFIRAELYQYSFTRLGDPSDNWWQRKRVGNYLPPLSLDNFEFRLLLDQHGWRV